MIRNNQNGRRRGRGGARPPQAGGGGGVPRENNYNNGGGNRIEVRQRGNAAQLLEKYKAMARDATQNGDRVAAEYYMQYADHYYRVLNDYRERQPETRQQPRRDFDDEDGGEGQNYSGQNYINGSSNGASNYAGQGGEAARYDDDGDDMDAAPRRDALPDGNRAPQQREPQNRDQHRQRSEPAPRRDDGRNNEARGNEGRRDESRNTEAHSGDDYRGDDGRNIANRNSASRNIDARNAEPRREEPRRTEIERDDDAPLTLAGLPGPATFAAETDAAAVDTPAPRKRGRPRKVVEVATDGDA